MAGRHDFHFFIDDELAAGDEARLGPRDIEHLKVLRGRSGQQVTIADAAGSVFTAEVTDPHNGVVKLHEILTRPRLHAVRVELLACVIEAGNRWDDLLAQAVQAGADEIIPVLDHPGDAAIARKRVQRTARVVEAAAKQSKRAARPAIGAPVALADAEPGELGILLEPDTDEQLVAVAQRELATIRPGDTVRLLIGPPRGISESAVASLTARGWVPAGMGRTILRSETAAAGAVLSLVQAAATWGPQPAR